MTQTTKATVVLTTTTRKIRTYAEKMEKINK